MRDSVTRRHRSFSRGWKTISWTSSRHVSTERDYYVFHSGTKFNENGQIVTNGGRVLGVTATGKDLKEARKKAYEATEWISFENKYMRHDIGKAIDDIHS